MGCTLYNAVDEMQFAYEFAYLSAQQANVNVITHYWALKYRLINWMDVRIASLDVIFVN